jgi:hypothetical protein
VLQFTFLQRQLDELLLPPPLLPLYMLLGGEGRRRAVHFDVFFEPLLLDQPNVPKSSAISGKKKPSLL